MLEVIFTDEITNFIIERVRGAEYMWNNNSRLHDNRALKSEFFEKLTEDINAKYTPFPPIDKADVCRKWHNLKSYYKYMHQKTSKAKQTNKNGDETIVDWKNKSKMDFILHKNTAPPPTKSRAKRRISKLEFLDDLSIHSRDSFFNNDNDNDNDNDAPSAHVVAELQEDKEEPAAEICGKSNGRDTPHEPSPSPKKRRMSRYGEPLAITSVKSLSSDADPCSGEPSELFHYGNFIVQSMRRLDRDLQIQAKKLLTNALLDLETQQVLRDVAKN